VPRSSVRTVRAGDIASSSFQLFYLRFETLVLGNPLPDDNGVQER
jgi:hypothetical protein